MGSSEDTQGNQRLLELTFRHSLGHRSGDLNSLSGFKDLCLQEIYKRFYMGTIGVL